MVDSTKQTRLFKPKARDVLDRLDAAVNQRTVIVHSYCVVRKCDWLPRAKAEMICHTMIRLTMIAHLMICRRHEPHSLK